MPARKGYSGRGRQCTAAWNLLLRAGLLLVAILGATPVAGDIPTRHIAIVISRPIRPYQEAAQGIEEQLATLPFKVSIDRFQLPESPDDLAHLVADMRAGGIELLFPIGTEAYQSLSSALPDIPMVISMVYDPREEFALDPTLQRNVYAANLRVPFAQQLRIVREFLPDREKITAVQMAERKPRPKDSLPESAQEVGFQVTSIVLQNLKDLEQALVRAKSEGDIFLMVLDKEIYSRATTQMILLFFARNRIPVISPSPNLVKAGALISISSLYRENGTTAARIGAAILSGQAIADRYTPTDGISIAWNDHVATILGIELPEAQRQMCDVIY